MAMANLSWLQNERVEVSIALLHWIIYMYIHVLYTCIHIHTYMYVQVLFIHKCVYHMWICTRAHAWCYTCKFKCDVIKYTSTRLKSVPWKLQYSVCISIHWISIHQHPALGYVYNRVFSAVFNLLQKFFRSSVCVKTSSSDIHVLDSTSAQTWKDFPIDLLSFFLLACHVWPILFVAWHIAVFTCRGNWCLHLMIIKLILKCFCINERDAVGKHYKHTHDGNRVVYLILLLLHVEETGLYM